MDPFLSIIIPVYNIKEEYLKACFDSLISQDMKEFRVIVVDDGSSDNNRSICDEYAIKDSRFVVIHQGNAGASVARNSGIEMVDTEWITFVDPDDWVENNHVSTLYVAQKEHFEIDIFLFDYVQEFVGCSVTKRLEINSGGLDSLWIHNLRLAPFNFFIVNGKPYEYETNTIWNKMYRTSLIRNNGLEFDPRARKGQDVIFNAECYQLTEKFYYVKVPLYHYRYLQGSITNRYNPKVQYYNEVAFEDYEAIIRKYRLPEEYWDAYYARVVTRIYSCMRLYYFHPENKGKKRTIRNELDITLNSYPYNKALERVAGDHLTQMQKVFVYFLKRRNYGILNLLMKARILLKNLKGYKLER